MKPGDIVLRKSSWHQYEQKVIFLSNVYQHNVNNDVFPLCNVLNLKSNKLRWVHKNELFDII